jgi:hypothetical protein
MQNANWTTFNINVRLADGPYEIALKTAGDPPTQFGAPFVLAQAMIDTRLPNRF